MRDIELPESVKEWAENKALELYKITNNGKNYIMKRYKVEIRLVVRLDRKLNKTITDIYLPQDAYEVVMKSINENDLDKNKLNIINIVKDICQLSGELNLKKIRE